MILNKKYCTWEEGGPHKKSKPRWKREKARFNQDKYNFNGINQDLSETLS